MFQTNYISKLLSKNCGAIIVGSLGSISSDLQKQVQEYNRFILVKGAMGCVIGVGLGIAMNTTDKVIVLVGDGSFLMKMGSISTILRYKPKNLKIIILNNNKYFSCGGQETNFKYIKNIAKKYFEVVDIKNEIHT
jgi:phosphonopyruvate decarboxylase